MKEGEENSRFLYVDIIWGRSYANLFTNVSLASRLSQHNLPSMPNNATSKTVIVTTDEDRVHIVGSSLFKRLEKLMEVVFLPLEKSTQGKYDLMSAGHRRGIEYAGGRGYCVFFAPDAIVADGSIPRLYQLALSGRQIVAGFGPCINQAAVLNELAIDPAADTGRLLTLPPRELVKIVLRHLHPNLSRQNVQSRQYPRQPNACLWDAPRGDGILARVLNMHPYLFDARLATPSLDLFNATLDWWVIPRALRDPNSYYVITDSDEFLVCGLLPEETGAQTAAGEKFDPAFLARYLVATGCPYFNRNNFLYGVKLHAGEMDESWARLDQDSYGTALDIIDPARLLKPYVVPWPVGGGAASWLNRFRQKK